MGGHNRLGIVCLGVLLWACGGDDMRDARAKLSVEPLHFGRVAVGVEEARSLVVKNHGRGSLSLLGIERGEGLAEVFSLPQDPARTIRGGEKAEIVVRFRPEKVQPYQGNVILLTDDPERPRLAVSLQGVGDRPSVACAGELAFGRVVLNTEKVLPLSCINGGRLRATIKMDGFGGDDPALFSLADANQSWEIGPGETIPIGVRFTAHRLGNANATLTISIPGAEDEVQEIALSGEGFASSLVAAPNCIHFGPVSPGQVATGRVIVANGGENPVNFDGPALVDASGVFAIASIRSGGRTVDLQRLEPQEQAEIEVEFAPASIGRFSGSLLLRNDDPVASHLEVCLTGNGGGADIAATPNPLDFGTVAVGMKVRKQVWVRNAGTLDGGPLEVYGATASGDGFSVVNGGPFTLDPADAAHPIEVELEATAEGTLAGTLLIESNDGDQPILPITLLATLKTLPPCEWVADPPVLRFAPVQVGATMALVTQLRNQGEDACVFASPRFSSGTASVFSLPDDVFSVALVGPGESLPVAVELDARSVGRRSGELVFDVSNPAAPLGSVSLESDVIDGCLRFEPPVADFGIRRASCPEAAFSVELVNRCGALVTIHEVELGSDGSTPGELGVEGPDTPIALAHNGRVPFTITYDPVDEGPDGAILEVATSIHALGLPISGRGTLSDERTDTFRQHARVPVDILFVIDNSGSMSDKQLAVAAGCEQFMRYAIQQGIDFHMGVTTTGTTRSVGGWVDCPGGAYGGEAGRLFPVNRQRPRWVTSTMPDAAQVFAENVQVGTCHWLEQGLEAAYRALSTPLVDLLDHPNTEAPLDGNLGFYRPEAKLSIVIISDEDDQSDRSTNFYKTFFRGLKGPGREDEISVNAVVGNGCGFGAEEGLRYMDVARATSGMIEPICTNDWGKALGRLAEQSFGYTLSFPLTARPEGTPRVRVDGTDVTTGWTYETSENAVVFTEDSAPPPGSLVEITYVPAC